jgi:LL-diaminopimelate aminotransferase
MSNNQKKPLVERMDKLPDNFFAGFITKIGTMQAAGYDVIRLDVGSPDMPPAPHIIEALAHSASAPGHHGYQSYAGPSALRQAWAAMYQRVFEVELDSDHEIIPLLGSKEGIFNLITAVVDPGEVVLVPDPGYMTYTRGTIFAGGEPYYLPLLPERDYLPDLESVPAKVAQRAKMLWLNYPNNPTAATATLEFFSKAVDFARQYNLLLCHDAAYTQITYNGYRAPSLLQVPKAKELVIEFNTLSKSHNMAGWRVGAALGSAAVLRALYKLKTNIDSSHFLPIMQAATTAMTSDQDWLVERNDTYRQRRDIVVQTLNALGLTAFNANASLYVWSTIPVGQSALDFANALLDEVHVSLTPGTVFGEQGEGYVRLSLTSPLKRIKQAMRRLTNWMKK